MTKKERSAALKRNFVCKWAAESVKEAAEKGDSTWEKKSNLAERRKY